MRKVLLLFFAFALGFTSYAQTDKSLVQTLNPKGAQHIRLNFNLPTTADTWKDETIRVFVEVNITNANATILDQLVKAGRYKIEGVKENTDFVIDLPNVKKEITVRGEKLIETISVKLMVPEYSDVKTSDNNTVEVSQAKKPAIEGMAARALPFKKFNCEVKIKCSNDPKYADLKLSDLLIDGKGVE